MERAQDTCNEGFLPQEIPTELPYRVAAQEQLVTSPLNAAPNQARGSEPDVDDDKTRELPRDLLWVSVSYTHLTLPTNREV